MYMSPTSLYTFLSYLPFQTITTRIITTEDVSPLHLRNIKCKYENKTCDDFLGKLVVYIWLNEGTLVTFYSIR